MTPPPSIGRIVLYRTESGSLHPAIVTATHGDLRVNLEVFTETRQDRFQNDVLFQVFEDGTPLSMCWGWPPYVPAAPR